MMETYRHYFDIDPDYFPAVNERVINDNPDIWKKFFPHETFIKLLKTTISVLDRKQKLSIWVEGAYGTGKSHAVLTLKKLLDVDDNEVQEYFEKYHLDKDLLSNFKRIKSSGRILTVHRYGSSNIHGDNDLILAIQESIEKALKKAGIENKANASLKKSIIRYLSDADNKASFNVFVKGSYANLFGGDDVDAIIAKLQKYEGEPLHILMEKIFKVSSERQIRAFSMEADDLANWIKEVIHANDLKAIVFIWDEFTEYFYNNTRNLTGFQNLCELSETEPFYFILVTHVSSSLFHEGDSDFIKINGRFVNPHSTISLPENIAFQLMGAAMEKDSDPTVLQDWKMVADDLADRTRKSRKVVGERARIKEKEMKDILPIHPYTALLLKHISQAYDSNQRSMFDFIKNDRGDEIKGFQWFIDNYGPEGGFDGTDNPLLTVDMLWDFFYEKGKEYLAHDVRNVLDYYNRVSKRGLDVDEKRVLKTVLLLQAISQHAADTVELFIPNEKNVDLAFEGSDLDNQAIRCVEKLCRDRILFKKQLGEGKIQYNAYINEATGAELEKYKKEIDDKDTSSLIHEPLNDDTSVAEALSFEEGALKLRYKLSYVSASDFDSTIRRLRNLEEGNTIRAVICFAKDDKESTVLAKKIQNALKMGAYHLVFIDATLTPFGQDGYTQYRDAMAQSLYQTGKDNSLATQYARNAKDALKKWKERINAGEFIVYTEDKLSGERATSKDILVSILQEIDRKEFPDCLEAAYHVTANLYKPSTIKLGVECGVNRKTRQSFSSSNVHTKLETALKDAWDDPKYWETRPNLLISKIKIAVDNEINSQFKLSGRISIREIWELLKAKPYGFMPCNLSAFILGFVLKEYVDGTYTWSDDLRNERLTLEKLKEMIDEVIKLQITPNSKYKDKYIVTLTPEEKAFNESTAVAFDVDEGLCTSIEQTREYVRTKMKGYAFPIWTLKEIISTQDCKTDTKVLMQLIDNYCGIANSNNLSGSRTDTDIANDIGRLFLENPNAAGDLKDLLTKENCRQGMLQYLQRFEDGALPRLAAEVGDNGQYINALGEKFDADAANWVWSQETAEQKIRESILEYKIIVESNKIISKSTTFKGTINEWCDKCNNIRISFAAAKNDFGHIEPFMAFLCKLKRVGSLIDNEQKKEFLKLLIAQGEGFKQFYRNQINLFKKVCGFYLDEFNEEEIQNVYQKLPLNKAFTMEKADYMNLVNQEVSQFRSSLGYKQLQKKWKERTNSSSPREWSDKHRMPILCLVSDEEIPKARRAFAVLDKRHPSADEVRQAKEYLEKAEFYSVMNDQVELDRIFSRSIIKNNAVMLNDVNEVKQYLENKIDADPYDWFGSPEVDKKLNQMAEAKYNQGGYNKALGKIDEMNADEVKHYLKELIKDNMTVGIEIIKSH